MADTGALKKAVGLEAAGLVEDGMVLGLGTGSTVAHFLLALSERLARGELNSILGVPTSIRTEQESRKLGIPLTSLSEHPILDLTVDGADEVDPNLNLIKGLGGALLREKMVAQASSRLAIMVDESKVVAALCEKAPVPIEVVKFGWETHEHFLQSLGGDSVLRRLPDGEPVTSDNGNHIIDCYFPGGIDDPEVLEGALAARTGVVESGLFIGMATQVIVAASEGVRHLYAGREQL